MDFKWTSSKVPCYHPGLENGDFAFYTSFCYKKEDFRVGEFVIVNDPNKKNPKIGMLLCLYKSKELWHNNSPFRGVVNWYSFAKNLDTKLQSKKKLDLNNEIVQDKVSSHIFINLEHITQKCQVIYATIDDPVYLISSNNLDKRNYFSCRYKIEDNCLVPIFTSKTENYIVNGKLSILPDFDELDVQKTNSESDLPEFISKNHVTPIKTFPLKYGDTKRRRFRSNSAELNSDTEFDNVKSPSKHMKLTPKSDKKLGSLKKAAVRSRSSSVRRVLNESFGSPSFPGTPPPAYKIVDSKCDSENRIKIKLKLNENQANTNVEDTVESKNGGVVAFEFVNINESNNNSELLSEKRVTKQHDLYDQGIRRSNRNVNRKSYVEFLSPQYETPTKRSRKTIVDSGKTTSSKVVIEDHGKPVKNLFGRRVTRSRSICQAVTPESSDNEEHLIESIEDKCKSDMTSLKTTKTNCRRVTRSQSICQAVTPTWNDNEEHIIPKRDTTSLKNTKTNCRRLTRSNSIYEAERNRGELNDSCSTRPKRNVRLPVKYTDDISETQTNTSLTSYDLKKKCDNVNVTPKSNSNSNYSTRPKRNVNQPIKYNEDIYISKPSVVSKKPGSETPKTVKRDLRKSILKNSTKEIVYESSSDEDITLKSPKHNAAIKTPTRAKCTPTAKAKMVREGVITPSVQNRENVVQNDGTPLGRARSQLHVSYIPNSLPCREKEFRDITNFLEGKLIDGCGGCMYISGVPGTGKTATVTEVINNLQQSVKSQEIPDFKYVNINGMRLSEPRQSYVEIVKQLMGKSVPWEQAQTMLENKFVKLKKKTSPVILVVDELDILCTKRQDVVYNLLDWPTKANTQLIVVTIANTMDLPERLLMGRVTSRLGLTRLTFQAYTHKQLQEIVTKRLAGTNAFNPDAIQLVARKVASVSGDARRALDICRRSAEIAELEGDDTLVSLVHVNQALSAMITQPKVQAIKRSSKLEKLVLQAVVAEVERTGVEETTFNNVFTMLVSLAALEGFKMVSNTVVMGIVAKLGACRLLLTDQKCNTIYQRIILNVSTDDVYYALTKTDF